MSFEPQTRIDILNRLLKNYKNMQVNPAESVEGTFSFDNLSANSVEFEKAYAEMALMMEAAFPQTSWGQYLEVTHRDRMVGRNASALVVSSMMTP